MPAGQGRSGAGDPGELCLEAVRFLKLLARKLSASATVFLDSCSTGRGEGEDDEPVRPFFSLLAARACLVAFLAGAFGGVEIGGAPPSPPEWRLGGASL